MVMPVLGLYPLTMCWRPMREVYRVMSEDSQDPFARQRVAYSNVIDPNFVRAIQGDSVASPNILRIQTRDSDVLNDNILFEG